MDLSCNFSFWDLHKAVFGKNPTSKFKKEFMNLPQDEINECVKDWASKAKWRTEKRRGTDNKIYIAFFP